jgi:hypothetical protein
VQHTEQILLNLNADIVAIMQHGFVEELLIIVMLVMEMGAKRVLAQVQVPAH